MANNINLLQQYPPNIHQFNIIVLLPVVFTQTTELKCLDVYEYLVFFGGGISLDSKTSVCLYKSLFHIGSNLCTSI